MLALLTLFTSVVLASAGHVVVPDAQTDCGTWQDCRDRAAAAAERSEFELFHDLAWRAVQKGPKNDPALLTLLARAQSLSGRPHDALVMLQRLATMGVVTDAAESDDYRRVRSLPGWTALQAAIAAAAAARPEPSAEAPPKPETPAPPAVLPKARRADAPAVRVDEASGKGGAGEVADTLRFTTVPFTPAGFAYDAVSNRFILGDRLEQKLSVIGAQSQRLVNLTGTESGGFGEIGALAIDVREGDLWVASSSEGEASSAKLHKLQLISGRLLATIALPEDPKRARLTDIAVTRQGVIVALDSTEGRLFKVTPGSHVAELMTELDLSDPSSIAPAQEGVVYVAIADGLVRVDIGARSTQRVRPARTIDLSGLTWIRWHGNRIVGVQRSAGGLYRIVRIRLDASGRTATRLDVLQKNVTMASESAADVADDALYYLTRESRYSASDGMDLVIRRMRLR